MKNDENKFVPADPRCKQCYYWRKLSSCVMTFSRGCHYCLETGKLRTKISKTECGSFVGKDSAPKRERSFEDVPMIQWGCGGLNIRKKWEV
jgi:hypothetical protein